MEDKLSNDEIPMIDAHSAMSELIYLLPSTHESNVVGETLTARQWRRLQNKPDRKPKALKGR